MTTFSPRDIKNRKFKQALMGVDGEEVKAFLKTVAAEFEMLLAQNALLDKRLTEQAVRSSLGRKDSGKDADSARQSLAEARRESEESLARAHREAEEILGAARSEAEETLARAAAESEDLRRRAEREAHDKARRETALMLSQAKVMADEIILNAKEKAEAIQQHARAAGVPSPERGTALPGSARRLPEPDDEDPGPPRDADDETAATFDGLMKEVRLKTASIIEKTRADAEQVTRSLIGSTLDDLNREHERLLAAVQKAVQKSEQIVRAARQQAEALASAEKADAIEQCNAVLLEAERKAGTLLSELQSRSAARKKQVSRPAESARKSIQ